MNFNLKGDKYIWGCSITLLLLGCLVFYSTVPSLLGSAAYTTSTILMLFIKKHLIFVILGFVLMYALHLVDYRHFSTWTRVFIVILIILLIVTNIIGVNEGSAMRKLVIFGFSFQPAEFAKVFLIADLSAILANFVKIKKDDFKLNKLWEMIFICTAVIGLVGMNSNSAGLILAITCYIMMWVAQLPRQFLQGAFFLFIFVIIIASMTNLFRTDVFVQRFETFVSRDFNKDGIVGSPEVRDNSQQEMAIMAVSTTRIPFGKLAGKSEMKTTLPLSYSDFAFSVFVEEYGIFGGITMVGLYLTILYRGIVNIHHTRKAYGGYLSFGLTFTIILQALIHIYVNTGIAPVTGQTLPLISQGGSSILSICMALGVILSVSRNELTETN